MVHELMHLSRYNWADEIWMHDNCPSKKLYPKRFAYFRARAASYQIGNMAPCFVWSLHENPCAWENAYRECAASPVRTHGKIRHKASAVAEYSVDLPECTVSESDVAE